MEFADRDVLTVLMGHHLERLLLRAAAALAGEIRGLHFYRLFGRTRDVTLQALDCFVDRRIRGCGWGGQGLLRLLGGLDERDIRF